MYRYPLGFFLVAIGFSWFFWSLSVTANIKAGSLLGIILLAAGGLGPSVSAMGFLTWGESRSVWKDFKSRLFLFGSGSWKPWIFLFAFPLILQVLSICGSILLGAPEKQLIPREEFHSPLKLIPFAALVFLFGPVPEEIGWRGYGLPALLRSVSPIYASGLISCFWCLWHIPLFFIPGYPLGDLLKEPLRLLFYLLDFFPNTLLYTWLFFSTKGSVAAAILFHWSGNFWGMAFETGTLAEGIALLLKTVCALHIAGRLQRS